MINYNQITTDALAIIAAGSYTDTIKEYFKEAMDRDFLLGNMPLINIRLDEAIVNPRSLPNGYYGAVLFKIDIASFDLSSFGKAAIVRNRILQEVQIQLQRNRVFGTGVETSVVGPNIEFSSGIVEGDNQAVRGHIASATIDFVVEVFIEPI